jgi:hypothetical protein
VEAICLPTTRVAELTAWIVQHAVAVEFTVWIEFALVLGSVTEDMLAICLTVKVLNGEGIGLLLLLR